MNYNIDSNSLLEYDKIFGQHFAILFMVQSKLDNPQLSDFKLFDLGCGKGQLISQLEVNLSNESRKKLSYFGYDINVFDLKTAKKTAESLNLKKSDFKVGDIGDFQKLIAENQEFDMIVMCNALHECNPHILAEILTESIIRLSATGSLFIYDMEYLSKRELGAITWQSHEMREILKVMFDSLGIKEYFPKPAQWLHNTCNSWSIHIQREFININLDEIDKPTITKNINDKVYEMLDRKLNETRNALEALTSGEDDIDKDDKDAKDEREKEKLDYLYNYWSIDRAIRGRKE